MERPVATGTAVLLGLVPTISLAAANGAYFPSAWGWPALAFLLVAAGAAVVRDRAALGRLELGLVAGLLALAALSAGSAAWSPGAQDQVLEAQRILVYAGAAGAFLLAVRAGEARALLTGVLGGIVVVGVWALFRRPGAGAESRQLAEPVGYWNALAILTVLGILIAVGLLATRGPLLLRGAAALAAGVLAPVLYLTYSRGAWVALAAGALATAALRAPPRARLALGGAAVAAVVMFLAAGGLERATAAFTSPLATEPQEDLSGRLTSLSGNGRAEYWRVARRQVEDEPLLGAGAGSFGRYWAQYRPNQFYARDAHNLYLETLAELGPLGLAVLLVTLALPLVAAVRGPPLAAHAGGAYAAFLAHAALDWDWEVPAVTVPALACACAAIRLTRPDERPLTPRLRGLALAAGVPLAAFAFAAQVGNSRIAQAQAALEAGEPAQAAEGAEAARAWAPWSAEPLRILGTVEINRGEERAAGAYLAKAVAKEPARWDLWWLLALGGGPEEERAIAEVGRLNPRSEELAALLAEGSP